MSDDLISRETIKKQMNAKCRSCDARFDVKECGRCGMEWAREIARSAPAVDAVPVVHGHWFFTEYEYFDCSVCGMAFWNGCESSKEAKEMLELGNTFNYCPNCGAKMDGDGKI